MPHRYVLVVHAVYEPILAVAPDAPDASPAVVSCELAVKTLPRAVILGAFQH